MTAPHRSNQNQDFVFQALHLLQAQHQSLNLNQFHSLVSARQYQLLYDLVDRYLPAGSAVLDWGCGNGHFSYFLVQSGYQTYSFSFGESPSDPVLQTLTQKGHYQHGNPNRPSALPYPDQQFDAVVSVGVLEHVWETGGSELASLAEIHRVLKPGGLFLCYHLPNQHSLIEQIASRIPNKYHHHRRYTPATITDLCQQSQFSLIALQPYGVLPRNSWNFLPARLRNSQVIANGWDAIDTYLQRPLAPLCQNYWFVAQKAT